MPRLRLRDALALWALLPLFAETWHLPTYHPPFHGDTILSLRTGLQTRLPARHHRSSAHVVGSEL